MINISNTVSGDTSVAIPGDTSFVENIDDITRWSSFYSGANLVSVHLGSIEKEWMQKIQRTRLTKFIIQKEDILD